MSVTNPRRRQHFKNALRQLGVLDPVARRGEMRGETGQGGAGRGEGRSWRDRGEGLEEGWDVTQYSNILKCSFIFSLCSNESHYCY